MSRLNCLMLPDRNQFLWHAPPCWDCRFEKYVLVMGHQLLCLYCMSSPQVCRATCRAFLWALLVWVLRLLSYSTLFARSLSTVMSDLPPIPSDIARMWVSLYPRFILTETNLIYAELHHLYVWQFRSCYQWYPFLLAGSLEAFGTDAYLGFL